MSAVALVFSVLVGPAHAQEAPPVVLGTPTRDYPAVGAFVAEDEGYGAVFCSGTVIEDQWVLTAGHCQVAAELYADEGYDIYFVVGTDVGTSAGVRDYERVDRTVLHPDYEDAPYLLNDVGLAHLEGALDGIEPIELNREDPATNSWTGDTLKYVGWGITGDGEVDAGTKRYADIAIEAIDSYFIYGYDTGGRNLCSGDSGGAALVVGDDGVTRIAGVNSFVYVTDSVTPRCEGGGNGAARVDQYLQWIGQHAKDSGGGSGGEGGTTAGSMGLPPEDKGGCATATVGATWALGMLGWMGVAGRARRED